MHTKGPKIDVDGALLHVEESGSPEGTELLFLHGGAGTLDDWDCVIDAFGDCRCVLLDTRGHGASTLGDGPMVYPRLADDAEAVIARTGMSAPIIVGHSDGGITGVHVATRVKTRLSGLVTIGAHGDVPHPDILRDIYDSLTSDRWKSRFPEMVTLYEVLNPDPDFDRLFAALVAMWRDDTPGNYPGPLAGSVRCPALILGGDADHLVPRQETVALAEAIETARLGIIPFGSHVPHWHHPDRVVPFIRGFLEENSANAGRGRLSWESGRK